jgi:hypothetical protein
MRAGWLNRYKAVVGATWGYMSIAERIPERQVSGIAPPYVALILVGASLTTLAILDRR